MVLLVTLMTAPLTQVDRLFRRYCLHLSLGGLGGPRWGSLSVGGKDYELSALRSVAVGRRGWGYLRLVYADRIFHLASGGGISSSF